MYPGETVGIRVCQTCRHAGAEVSTLREISLVAETAHQFGPQLGNAEQVETRPGRPARKAIAGDRRDHDIEGVLPSSAVRKRVGQKRDHPMKFEDAAWPTMGEYD